MFQFIQVSAGYNNQMGLSAVPTIYKFETVSGETWLLSLGQWVRIPEQAPVSNSYRTITPPVYETPNTPYGHSPDGTRPGQYIPVGANAIAEAIHGGAALSGDGTFRYGFTGEATGSR